MVRFSEGLVFAMLVLSRLALSSAAFNITKVLEPFPDFSQLNQWFSKTGVADEINNRTALTILAPSNEILQGYISGVSNAWTDPGKVADTLRYHVLLTYYGMTELRQVPLKNGTSVTTLLQTTGRANQTQGFVTLYNNGTTFQVGHEFADSYGNETILGNVTEVPYQYSILKVSSILAPAPPSLPAPASAPSPAKLKAPTPSPAAPKGTPVTATDAPVDPTGGSHASAQSVSKTLVLLGMLVACGIALL